MSVVNTDGITSPSVLHKPYNNITGYLQKGTKRLDINSLGNIERISESAYSISYFLFATLRFLMKCIINLVGHDPSN